MDEDEYLMAVLLGQPAGATDTAHASAERDMAVVREQLHRIGDGLARADGGPPHNRVRRRRHRGLLVLAASVALAALGTGTAYLAAHPGSPLGGGAEAKLTTEGLLACSTAIAEGVVARIEPLDGKDRFRIILDVEHFYKPESGQTQLAFTAEGADTSMYYKTGVRMLVVVSQFPGEGPETFRAGDPSPQESQSGQADDSLGWGRAWVQDALPGALGQACPGQG